MSSIPELLKKGFDSNDWEYVSQAHQMLTGQSLVAEEAEIKEDVGFAEEVRTNESESYISAVYDGDHPDFQSDESSQRAKKEPINSKKRKNLWVDDGTIAADEKVSENPSLGVKSPVKRTRPKAKKKSNTKSSGDVRLDQSEKLRDIND